MYALLDVLKSFIYGGVDYEIPGNGGSSCFDSLSVKRRIFESILIISIALMEIWWSKKKISETKEEVDDTLQNQCLLNKYCSESTIRTLRKMMLALLLVIFSLEVAYKVTEGSLIYLLNPCHITSFFQIYFLIPNANPNRIKTMFRIHLHLLSGALLALALPVTNTRTRFFEVESYWLHHYFIYICVPLFLLATGGCFKVESSTDYYWPTLSVGVTVLYHFTTLQPIAMITQVNLNNILCPAISDPFAGPNYRVWAFFHQHLLIFLHAKLYPLLAFAILSSIDYSIRGLQWVLLDKFQAKIITIKSGSISGNHDKFD